MPPFRRHALIACCILCAPFAHAAAQDDWLLAVDRWGTKEYRVAHLDQGGGTVTGRVGTWPLHGTRQGNRLAFTATDDDGRAHRFTGEIAGDRFHGDAEYPDTQDRDRQVPHAFTARRLPDRQQVGPTIHDVVPTTFANTFSADRMPVLAIRAGDIVRTQTLDSGGVDRHGDTRALYGNPQTGPFFVVGAEPGDVLAVHLRRLRLDRDHADSLDGFVGRVLTPTLAARTGDGRQPVRWRLDRAAGVARLDQPSERLAQYTVPLRPMLGGIGVAPDFGFAAASTGDSGRFGGNMDFNGIVEGVTVYLPVFQPGALLHLGDGHAAQGDGETTQWALETSLDVEFSVDVLPARALATPRVASADTLTVIGQAGSLDEAIRVATAGMVQWLEQDYGLDTRESALVLGTVAEYRVATVAGRNAGMALSLPRARLPAPVARDRGGIGD